MARQLFAAIAVIVGVFTAPQSANAAFSLFTDRPSFVAASTSVTTIDFNDQVTSTSGFTFYPGATFSQSGVTFAGNGILFAVSPSFFAGYDLGDGVVLTFQQALSPNQSLSISLPTGVTAVGLDFGLTGSSQFVTFTLATGEVIILTGNQTNGGPVGFFGVTTSAPLTGLTIQSPVASVPVIDLFSFGTAGSSVVTPVPPTMLAAFMGAAVLGINRSRRRI